MGEAPARGSCSRGHETAAPPQREPRGLARASGRAGATERRALWRARGAAGSGGRQTWTREVWTGARPPRWGRGPGGRTGWGAGQDQQRGALLGANTRAAAGTVGQNGAGRGAPEPGTGADPVLGRSSTTEVLWRLAVSPWRAWGRRARWAQAWSGRAHPAGPSRAAALWTGLWGHPVSQLNKPGRVSASRGDDTLTRAEAGCPYAVPGAPFPSPGS